MASSVEKSNSVDQVPPAEKFESAPTREALSQHEGTAVVRKILWKLDIQWVCPLITWLSSDIRVRGD